MKFYNYLLFGAALFTTASCSEDLIPELQPAGSTVVKATIESVDMSRAAIESGKVKWSLNDKIAVLQSDNKYATLELNDSDAGKESGSFSGAIIGDGVTIHETAHAYYPASIVKDNENVSLPAVYDVKGDLSNSNAFMKAQISEGTLYFEHLGGVLKFKLKDVPAGASQFVFTTLDNKNITGDFALTEVEGKTAIAATDGDGSNSTITIKFTALTEVSSIEVSVPLPVGEYEGIGIAIKDADGVDKVKPVKFAGANNTISRKGLVTLPTITFVTLSTGDVDVAAGKVRCNGNFYDNIAAALAENSGATLVEIFEGTYAFPNSLSDITVQGNGKSKLDITTVPTRYSNVTIKNVNIFNSANANYKGFQHADNITFEDCVFDGIMFGYGTLETYKNCTFNQTTREYHMWTYGANSVYDGCTFNGNGKFLHLYNEQANGSAPAETPLYVKVKNCKFVNNGTKADKAAVVLKSSISSKFDLTITNCTTDGQFNTENDPAGLWQVDGVNPDRLSITVDGEKVYPPVPDVTEESDGSYTINTAAGIVQMQNLFVTVDSKPIVINMIAGKEYDMTGLTYANSDDGYNGPHPKKHVTIKGNGATIKNLSVTGLQATLIPWTSQGFTVKDLTIKDSSFVGNNAINDYCAAAAFGAFCDYTSVSISGCTLDNVTIGGGKYVGGFVAYCTGSASQFEDLTVKNCKISSNFTKDGTNYQGHCGGIIGASNGGTLTNCTIVGTAFDVEGNRGGIVAGSLWGTLSGTVTVSGNTGLDAYAGNVGTALLTATVTVTEE